LDGGKLGVHCAGTEYVFTNSNITKSPAIKQKGGKKLISFRPGSCVVCYFLEIIFAVKARTFACGSK
ncbi:hypothetical protein, partial [uncultured Alistipes sp.]